MKYASILFSCLFILFSCGKNAPDFSRESAKSAPGMAQEMAMEDDLAYQDEQSTGSTVNVAPKVIKNATMRIEVKDIDASTQAVEQLVQSLDGRISNMNRMNYDYRKENNITIRIPSDQFDTVIKGLEKETVYQDYLRVDTRDVTEEFLDIETRLKTKKAVRDRYVEVLRKQAKTVEEILQAEEAIRKVQEEIESREGRLRYLKDQVSFSTIVLELYEKQEGPAPSRYSFIDRAKESLYNGWELIQDTALVVMNLWPFVILALLLWWILRWRSKKKKAADSVK